MNSKSMNPTRKILALKGNKAFNTTHHMKRKIYHVKHKDHYVSFDSKHIEIINEKTYRYNLPEVNTSNRTKSVQVDRYKSSSAQIK
jgi:hypothetical protein